MSETEDTALEAMDLVDKATSILAERMQKAGMGEDAQRLLRLLFELQEWAIQAAYDRVSPKRGKDLVSRVRALIV